MKNKPIIIVGMARSGTTLTTHVLGSLPNTHTEIEPHALWKSGNFKYFNDEEFDLDQKNIESVRKKFIDQIPKGKVLIEKSPINCLRPELVHKVFPEAKVVYVERDPVRCIYSNYVRSLKNDSFKLSIILKKYFLKSGSQDLDGAIGKRGLLQQISISDIPHFLSYSSRMMFVRNIQNLLPFGPKLKGFADIVNNDGLLYYHTKVYKEALKRKELFKEYYGEENFAIFSMEDLMSEKAEIERLVHFSEIRYDEEWLNKILKTLNPDRIKESSKPRDEDEQIRKLLTQDF